MPQVCAPRSYSFWVILAQDITDGFLFSKKKVLFGLSCSRISFLLMQQLARIYLASIAFFHFTSQSCQIKFSWWWMSRAFWPLDKTQVLWLSCQRWNGITPPPCSPQDEEQIRTKHHQHSSSTRRHSSMNTEWLSALVNVRSCFHSVLSQTPNLLSPKWSQCWHIVTK